MGGPSITKMQKLLADRRKEHLQQAFDFEGAVGPMTKEKHIMLQQIQLDLTNGNNLQYIGPVLVGTPLQDGGSSLFVYDSGSGYLTVTTEGCTSCSSVAYNPALSDTVTGSSYTTTQLVYGSATLNGQMAADSVCLLANATNTCVTDFSFFEIESQTGLDGVDGILGFSPTQRTDPSYLWTLYKQGQISQPVVSFWINQETLPSIVSFGGVPSGSYMSDFAEQSLDTAYNEWWTLRFHGTAINGNQLTYSKGVYAIVDTGTSLLYMVQSDYDQFKSYVEAASSDFNCSSLLTSFCFST